MFLEFVMLQGLVAHGQRAMTQKELEERQLSQAAGTRNMNDEELAQRYGQGQGLMNLWRPSPQSKASDS